MLESLPRALQGLRGLAVALALSGCGGAAVAPELSRAEHTGSALPLEPGELVLGASQAGVTLIAFVDYAAPAASATVAALERARRARPDDVRYVLKPYPSCSRAGSRAAASALEAVLELRGAGAALRFRELLLAYPERLGAAAFLRQAARDVGVTPAELALFDEARFAQRVQRSLELARRLGVAGAPTTFVNGFELAGVPVAEVLDARIDVELLAVQAHADDDASALERYVARVSENRRAAAERAPPEAPGVQRVPVAGSAARGLGDARLTLVEFSSFTSGCAKAEQASLEGLEATYGARLRRVFKHLAADGAARDAANFAEYARAVGGDARFFQAARLLWQASPELERATLERLARVLGLDPQGALAAVDNDRFSERIDADRALAEDLGVEREPNGELLAPLLFLNGQRLPSGASRRSQALLIEQRLELAEQRLRAGTPASTLYEALLEAAPRARAPGVSPELDAERMPYRGARAAPVRVEMFASYAQAACSIPDSLQRLFVQYPGRIQLSFRPLGAVGSADAERERRAQEAAFEAHAQLGNPGFWQLARLMCDGGGAPGVERLERYAEQARLDLGRLRTALATRRHRAKVDASAALAARWGFTEGPRFVINGERLEGEALAARARRTLGEAQ
jgi:protein-disulfide isomerase